MAFFGKVDEYRACSSWSCFVIGGEDVELSELRAASLGASLGAGLTDRKDKS